MTDVARTPGWDVDPFDHCGPITSAMTLGDVERLMGPPTRTKTTQGGMIASWPSLRVSIVDARPSLSSVTVFKEIRCTYRGVDLVGTVKKLQARLAHFDDLVVQRNRNGLLITPGLTMSTLLDKQQTNGVWVQLDPLDPPDHAFLPREMTAEEILAISIAARQERAEMTGEC